MAAASLWAGVLAFLVFAVYLLYLNQEVLYTAHDRSEFIVGATYFHTLGAWLTQLFYHPALGAGVLAAVWVLIFLVGAKAFQLKGSSAALMLLPVACLLTSVVDLGYWIYIFSIRGYWFSQSVAYLAMLFLLWAARCTPRKWHLAWYLLAVCLYPLLGWYALLFILCLALAAKPGFRELAGMVLYPAAAYLWHALLYPHMRLEEVMQAGWPCFVTPVDTGSHLTIPFWVLAAVSVLIALCGRFLVKARLLVKRAVPVLCALAGIGFTASLMFQPTSSPP